MEIWFYDTLLIVLPLLLFQLLLFPLPLQFCSIVLLLFLFSLGFLQLLLFLLLLQFCSIVSLLFSLFPSLSSSTSSTCHTLRLTEYQRDGKIKYCSLCCVSFPLDQERAQPAENHLALLRQYNHTLHSSRLGPLVARLHGANAIKLVARQTRAFLRLCSIQREKLGVCE